MTDMQSEQKIIQTAMILVIVGGTSGLAVWAFSTPTDTAKNTDPGTEFAVSGFGQIGIYNQEKAGLSPADTYQDPQLGFQISKPGSDWEFHAVLDDMDPGFLHSLKAKGFLDGVYVEQDHDRRFTLTVFDVRQQENFSLHGYVDDQIALAGSQNMGVPFEQVSPNDDWALFAVDSPGGAEPYGEQMMLLREGLLYVLQYYGEPPQSLSSTQRDDIRRIMDSFEVI